MKRRLAAAVLAAVAILAAPGKAQEVTSPEGVVVRRLPGLPQGSSHGYAEIAFQVINRSEQPHRVTLVMPDEGAGWTGALRNLSNEAILEPGASARLALYQPALPIGGFGTRIFVDQRPLPDSIHFTVAHPGDESVYTAAGTIHDAHRILVSQSISLAASSSMDEAFLLQRAETGVDAWSDSWLAYSGFDGIVVSRAELDLVSAGVRSALVRYVETGGSLAVTGASELPAWLEIEPHGRAREKRVEVVYRGLGVCLLLPDGIAGLHPASNTRLLESWQHTRGAWDLLRDPTSVHRLFPVIDSLKVPVRGLFLVVLAFTVLIGPVNVVILTRRRRRIHLLWTVPVAALVTSLVVFTYAWVGEGLIRIHSSAGLTILDQTERRAVTLAWTGYYATLTPSEGLRFDRETEVSPVLHWGQMMGSGSSRSLRLADSQHFDSGWVTARLPSYFMVRKSELRRERLRVRPAADGSLEALNGLGATIVALFLADGEGRIHTSGEPIVAGAAGRLTATGERARGGASSLRKLFRADLPSRLQVVTSESGTFLNAATYVAVLATNPFLEPGLADAREQKCSAVVYGFLPRSMELAEAE